MSEQRFKHNLNKTARTLLGTYFNDVQDQSATFHLAGRVVITWLMTPLCRWLITVSLARS
ncbi:Uncharacterised protein [Yersinia intermedia]|nr:Uncharacterised protein [Yersinia intermedia]